MEEKQLHPLLRDRAVGLSTVASRMLRKAVTAVARREFDAADVAVAGVLALAPENAEALRVLGMLEQMRGNHALAIVALRRALIARPDDALILMSLGTSLHDNGDIDEALASLQRASQLAPDFASAWFNLGKMLKLNARESGAVTALHRAVDLDPDHLPSRILLAEVQASLGAIPNAVASYRNVLKVRPDDPDAWIGLANLKTERFGANDVELMKRALNSPQASARARIALGFALAQAQEDQADYAAAFENLQQANALKRGKVSWDRSVATAYADAILEAFEQPLAGAPDARLGEEVIFIVCLPRSGSTLTEQILASHPQVEGAEELTELKDVLDEESAHRGLPFPQWTGAATPEDWSRLGRDYLARTGCWRRQRPRFTDKSLINWRFVGAAMAMLPGARVINSRRNAVENCFGCYRQLFVSGNHFSYDLDEMAAHWLDYDRLSRHWKRVFTQRFFEHTYEDLLTDPEAQVRRLLDFCGLDFDAACLEFHRTRRTVRTASAAQVRQPLQHNVARSALYDEHLDRLRDLLGVGKLPGRTITGA
jgi:tetratricopeptide (TPR) repeat protein